MHKIFSKYIKDNQYRKVDCSYLRDRNEDNSIRNLKLLGEGIKLLLNNLMNLE